MKLSTFFNVLKVLNMLLEVVLIAFCLSARSYRASKPEQNRINVKKTKASS